MVEFNAVWLAILEVSNKHLFECIHYGSINRCCDLNVMVLIGSLARSPLTTSGYDNYPYSWTFSLSLSLCSVIV